MVEDNNAVSVCGRCVESRTAVAGEGIGRRTFLVQSGILAAIAALSACAGIGSDITSPNVPANSTIDVNNYPALANVGGVAMVDFGSAPVAVVRSGTSSFLALSRVCPHQGRLTIHRLTSYTMIPLFVAEYSLGENLINDAAPATWLKPAHAAVASGIGVLFAVNTVTGLWNLWDAREDTDGRTRRTVHSILMLASDAGFLATAALTPERQEGGFTDYASYRHRVNLHRGVAIGSFALSTIGGAMMWFWK